MLPLIAIWTSNPVLIRRKLRSREYNIRSLFYAHGMIPGVDEKVLISIVDEFGRAAERFPDDKAAFLLAINSRVSLNILSGQGLDLPKDALDKPYKEAEKIIPLLNRAHPSRQIITATFDDTDPGPLYRTLSVPGGGIAIPYAFTMQGNAPVPL